jgi:SAM-dependent methyltransferase
MRPAHDPDTRRAYDAVAREYAARIYGELGHKPFDRAQLDRLAERAGALGPICDLGCGPGQVARYLAEGGARALGVDLAPGMLAEARRLNPGLAFCAGDMLALPVAEGAWGGIAAFYSLIHIDRARLPAALAELRRALCPGGWLLAAFHLGRDTVHLDEWWGAAVRLDFHFFETDELCRALADAGFRALEALERDPYPPAVEHQSRRAYLFAQK